MSSKSQIRSEWNKEAILQVVETALDAEKNYLDECFRALAADSERLPERIAAHDIRSAGICPEHETWYEEVWTKSLLRSGSPSQGSFWDSEVPLDGIGAVDLLWISPRPKGIVLLETKVQGAERLGLRHAFFYALALMRMMQVKVPIFFGVLSVPAPADLETTISKEKLRRVELDRTELQEEGLIALPPLGARRSEKIRLVGNEEVPGGVEVFLWKDSEPEDVEVIQDFPVSLVGMSL